MAKVSPNRKNPNTKTSSVTVVPRNAGTTPLATKKDQKKKVYNSKIIGRF